ncbi:acyltransferase family protein [Rhizobium grahamii]|uniref:Acyltransferase 3 n=1 Tax=Rhizobium grahamii CCGE 502 TaxID=990285 RepID=S3HEF9_9HYPH|nr:acyltransferase [Rhizobium grahamii]EPE97109.1 acyltransferase 3 [Rhizobium grahamii CCGE 502]
MIKRVEFVNTLRGLAAVFVVISHYLGVFWFYRPIVADLIKSGKPTPDGVPIYVEWVSIHPLFNWGMFGVAIFFLISGFVIPASLTKLSSSNFLKHRAFRILPTYVVGFGISLAAIAYNVRVAGAEWPFPFSHVVAHFFPGIRDVLGLTNIDGIIWTLEIEVKFYLVCALIAPLFARQSLRVFITPALLAALIFALATVLAPTMATLLGRLLFAAQFIVFMFSGTAFYYVWTGRISERKGLFLSFVLLLTFAALVVVNPVGVPTDKTVLNYGFAYLLFWFAFAFPQFFPKNAIIDFFADISYPLYVVHGVFGYSILTVMRANGYRASICLISTTVIAIAVSYAIHILVEKPCQTWLKAARPTKLAPAE